MRLARKLLHGAGPWLLTLILTDVFFVFLLWLVVPERLGILSAILAVFSGLVFVATFLAVRRRDLRIANAIQSFLANPDEDTAGRVLNLLDPSRQEVFVNIKEKLARSERSVTKREEDLENYRSFIEAWAHEIKTPLTLLTLVLDNHGATMTPHVRDRMEYVRHEIGADVDRVLYYARLIAGRSDLKYTSISLRDLVEQVFADFAPICEERQIRVTRELANLSVVTDRKVLAFILAQLLSNAVKYCSPTGGQIRITAQRDASSKSVRLVVRDNGAGAAAEDLPFLFDKGFTGSRPDRQNATGMGLYFVRKFAESLSVNYGIDSHSEGGNGFGIYLEFPEVLPKNS